MNNVNTQKPHSAEYFGDSRDYWWNRDFLELMAKRLGLAQARSMLDVGSGVGHWGRILSSVLSPELKVTGIEREPEWVKKATDQVRASGLGDRFNYLEGVAEDLPFSDGTFDLVTCQTVLIHLKYPKVAIKEMLRVLKPGGTILVVEPNNIASSTLFDSLTIQYSPDVFFEYAKFKLICEKGKAALGLGFNSIGDLVPGYLSELGAQNISVYLSDKASPLLPPYETKEQQSFITENKDWISRDFIVWELAEAKSYFIAGGGSESEFQIYREIFRAANQRYLKAIEDSTYHSAGGSVQYLISGTKTER